MAERYGALKQWLSLFAFSTVLMPSLFPLSAFASPASLTYQGRVLKADGSPLQHNNVSFLFQITDPNGACVVYEEQVNGYNMNNSGGVFDVPIGLGSRSWPVSGSFTILDSMNNSGALSCYGGSTYNPSLDDIRKLRVQFYDGTGWKLISPDNVIRSVPYAGYAASAARLGTNVANDFLLKAGLPTCGTGTFLSWNGTALSCAPVAGASGGTVTEVTSANTYLSVLNGTSTPQLTLNVGTSSGTVAAGDDSRFINARAPTGTAGGDLSGTYPNPSVAKINGVDVSITAPSSGDFLKFNGTNWQGTAITISDVTTLTTALNAKVNVSQFPSSCAADQALTFSSPTGTFVCASIAIAGAQVSGNITGSAAGFTGALIGDVSGTQGATSVDKIKGVPVVMTGNGSGKVLTFNGTSWAPADPATSGTVTSVSSTNSYLSVAGTTTPALTLNVGATANTVAAGNDTRIVNAIQNAGSTVSIQSGLEAALPASSLDGKVYIATDTQKIYRDNGTAWIVIATAAGGGGTVTSVASGAGLTGGPITGTGTLAVDVGTSSGKILQLDASARIPAVDGSLITNLSSASLSGIVPVDKGGTGQSSYTDGQILIGNTTNNTLSKQILNGDAAMTNTGLVTVNGVKGKSVSAAPTLQGQMLRYDGTNWTPAFTSMFDLRSTLTGAQAFGGIGCTAGQTLTWTALTDNLACTNISLPVAQLTGTLPVANGGSGVSSTSQGFVFAGPATGGAGAPVFRALASTDLPSTVTNGLWTESSGNVYRSTGNVGIGTNAPARRLHVEGPIRLAASSAPSSPLAGDIYIDSGDSNALKYHNGTSWVEVGEVAAGGFTLESWQAPTFLNSWVDYGSGYNNAGYYKDPFGRVFLRGLVKSGTMSNCIFMLPVGYRPASRELFDSMSDNAQGRVDITTDGCVLPANGANPWVSLDGISFQSLSGGTFTGNSNPWSVNGSNIGFGAGNVGIGTTTPGHILDVVGLPAINGGSREVLSLFDSTAMASGVGAGISFGGKYTASGTYAGQFAGINGVKENSTDGDYAGALQFMTRINGANPTERMRIDSSGNVGIGMTNPAFKLDVLGGSGNGLKYSDGTRSAVVGVGTTSAQVGSLSSHPLDLLVGSVTRMSIDTNGNVGIGTTSPTTKLEVSGTIKATNYQGTVNGLRMAGGYFGFASGACGATAGGACTIDISSGGFSSIPNCTITMISSDGTGYTEKMVIQSITATVLKVWKGVFPDSGTTMQGQWICIGAG